MLISGEFPSKYIKSEDLQGKQIKLIMSRVDREKIGEDSRPVLYFKGIEKGLVLNKTNSFKIKETYGDDTEEWAGQPIILFAIMTDFRGETVQGIRVRAPTAKEMQPVVQTPIAPKDVFPPDRISSGPRDKFASGLPSEFPDEYLEER
jgi:hypothetical protein